MKRKNELKVYVLMLSKEFPKEHPKAGQPTRFAHLLGNGLNLTEDGLRICKHKIHTIRANYPLWKERIAEIQRGKACLSVRQWTGKPYRSSQVEIAKLTVADRVHVQKLNFNCDILNFEIDNRGYTASPSMLAWHDGLTVEEWRDWFKGYDLTKSMAIIHFTPFRY